MVNKLVFNQRFLVFITPLITSSVLIQLILSITALPSLAATLASSETTVELNNFSYNPQKISTLTVTNTFTSVSDGSVTAQAEANAIGNFDPNNPPTGFYNFSSSITSSKSSKDFGLAQSQAVVIGYDFLVGNNKAFSFDFQAVLDLNISINEPQSENASADGSISFLLYDSTNSNNQLPLDYLTLSGNLISSGSGNSLDIEKSTSISFNSSETSIKQTPGATKVLLQGSLSHFFDSQTSLTLIEVKNNQALVGIPVPEPSNDVALVFSFSLIYFINRLRNKLVISTKFNH